MNTGVVVGLGVGLKAEGVAAGLFGIGVDVWLALTICVAEGSSVNSLFEFTGARTS